MSCYCMQTCFSIFTIEDYVLNKQTYFLFIINFLIVYYKRYQSLLKTILSIFRDSIEWIK